MSEQNAALVILIPVPWSEKPIELRLHFWLAVMAIACVVAATVWLL